MKPDFSYAATVVRCVDGDTVTLDIDCGFSIFTRQTTRLFGLDTAETRMVRGGSQDLKSLGKLAKQFVQEALPVGKEVTIKTHKEGKFGRILAEIYINGGDDSLNDLLIKRRMAVQYYGQSKDLILEQHKICIAYHKKIGNI
jgi:endonuclease YncB( thermonuclease family)|tara:strand:+ start:44 stop:469 length:426 start_codon:yes stop_codon:yes gene_type:complete